MIMVRVILYIENVVINKKVNLEAASDLVTVQALNSSKPVFSIYSVGSGSVIQDFMVTGGTGSSGICLNTASGCVITNNRLTNNGNGIFLFNSIGNIYWR